MSAFKTIAIIGFGEAGGILGAELAKRDRAVRAYDILLDDAATRDAMAKKAAAAGVAAADSHAAAVKGADLVISSVTAACAVDVARAFAPHGARGQVFLDINSISPEAKRGNARAIEASGADYVEAAVMAAVPPKRLKVPMLLGGPRAREVGATLNAMGFSTEVAGDAIGIASAIKMCRSVMIKGLEALTVECLLGARRYGAEKEVLASLAGTFPGMGWDKDLPNYLIGRVAEHGRRRAAEMREVAATLTGGGIAPRMASSTAELHDWFVDALGAADAAWNGDGAFDWRKSVDALLKSAAAEKLLPRAAGEGRVGVGERAQRPK
jgi:3-hydroxyisobutyrate dehydrogenase-like beta-hydroxyacid dehydrogenase